MKIGPDSCWNIPNPTSLNARRQLDRLLVLLPHPSTLTAAFHAALSQNALLPTISHFLLRPSLTMVIAQAFLPLLMDLCARWLDADGEVWEKLEALGLLIEIHEELFPILSSFLRRFERGPLFVFLGEKEIREVDRVSMHRVLLAYFRILHATPALPRNLNWDLACLLKLCATPNLDRGSRWLAIRCYSLQANMSESVRIRMEQDVLGEICDEDCPIIYGEDLSGVVKEVDGWLLPVLELRRIRDYRENILNSPDYVFADEESDIAVRDVDLSPRIANIHGILLLRSSLPKVTSSLVLTSSALLALRQIAVNISLRRPTLLTSAASSGKMTFLNHLSGILHPSSPNQVITIHLADTSLDPRSLLGSYMTSSTSTGSFEWKDGILVKAMREGRWVVFKDIDRASSEVLGLITPLAESMEDIRPIGSNATLSLGVRGVVEAAESFALFATRSVERADAAELPPLTFLGAQKWREIIVLENSLDDLQLIVDSKFPNIAGPVSDSLIDIWLTVKHLRVVSSSRTIGIRDLEKFCSRVSHFLESNRAIPSHQRQLGEPPLPMMALFPHPSIREEIYLDARDVFFAAGTWNKPALEQRDAIAKAIGEKLALSEETCEWLVKRRTPVFEVEKDVDGRPLIVRAGRTVLSVNPINHLSNPGSIHPFSMHKQAIRLISQVAACVGAVEPVLLTGETGTGKTSVITYLASILNKPLISLNLSNQTESSDLVGGFRPVSARVPALELQQRFTELFQKTFSSKKNEHLLQSLRKAIANGKWKVTVKLWSETARTAIDKVKERDADSNILRSEEALDTMDTPMPRKRRKVLGDSPRSSIAEWMAFQGDVHHFEVLHVLEKGKFSFQFAEGPLVKALRTGAWVLLDEINLASPETLECIAGLLQGPSSSIILTEQGSLEPVPRHLSFRLFACMNPATDVGKKELPCNIRTKFTEIEVPPPDDDQEALVSVIMHYIGRLAITDKAVISDIAELYTRLKELSASGRIADCSNHRPHYSMRSLSRALTYAGDAVQLFGLRRALWEGFTMTFMMVLDQGSAEVVSDLAQRTLLSTVKNKTHFLSIQPPPPQDVSIDSHVRVGPFWLSSGPCEHEEPADYILTPSVQKKLVDLARIVMTKRYPVLIEGPTSSGKTSAIQYLARRTGHNFVRINNHEHTDIQEYLGSYISDSKSGKLVFRDGLLVRALRRGDWIVLDELNLAPTDVLEALNRLLDENRELIIPETQEVVRPHPNFMLFATQNPPGVYAGRKVLSRALRNRFLEVHFEDVPSTELEHILSQRSRIAPSYSQRIVAVFHELQKRRQIGRIFEGKEGFATLRDLFRWAGRDAQGYQELAENGYMLLAERTRRDEDKLVVKEVIEGVMKVSITETSLYDVDKFGCAMTSPSGIIWTRPMQRLFVLLSRALRHNEPVLLVGETGAGKTSVCQVYAEIENKVLRTVNCHQNTEAADIIGGLRPVRQIASVELRMVQELADVLGISAEVDFMDKTQLMHLITARLEEGLTPHDRDVLLLAQRALSPGRGLVAWQDGPLVMSMRSGDVFLLDEISLADDSVLERLNSVLEPGRTLVLAEKGGEAADDFEVVANNKFKFVATMNPGGDFGKKELSPALRNRFTEIWVPSVMNRDDLTEIVKPSWKHNELAQLTEPILDFVGWIAKEVGDVSIVTLRDILSWVDLCNRLSRTTSLPPAVLFVQGGEMTILDGLYSVMQLSSWSAESLKALYLRARNRLVELGSFSGGCYQAEPLGFSVDGGGLRIGPFSIPVGSQPSQVESFSFQAPTSLENAFRLLRACQIPKPVLLEGSPGVGKTSLVAALASAAGQKLARINLSEQTDLVDLFGSDLPLEGHAAGNFGWNDAEFLRALKKGDWVLLDEMNLASQSVLEGLNAVFDHRGSVYIPELDRSFLCHPNFRVFAAQNPLNQGSGRKGLPKSFLNRFTKVYIEQLSPTDLFLICQHLFPCIEPSILQRMITFNCRLHEEVAIKRQFGISGAPWEFNLRDVLRWGSLMMHPDGTIGEPWQYVNTVYRTRFRTESDRTALLSLFTIVFDDVNVARKIRPTLICTPQYVACGSSQLRKGEISKADRGPVLLSSQLDRLDSALSSLSQSWLIIVTGPHSSGKTSFARALASMAGRSLEELPLGSSSDTSDLIGSFEQTSVELHAQHLLETLFRFIDICIAQTRVDSINALALLLRLKDEAVEARQTGSLDSLRELVRSSLAISLLNAEDMQSRSSLKDALDLSTSIKDTDPSFEWIDGPLVRAMKQGQWLLLDNANFCSPTVLDRLNSICEVNGSIVLTERGVDQEKIYPHPEFRLIMTVDPYRGEISRAMRNRGIEIALGSSTGEADVGSLLGAKRLNAHHMFSRSTFELCRRALYFPPGSESDVRAIPPITYRDNADTLSSQFMEIEALVGHFDPTDNTAIVQFVFNHSSPFSSKGLFRLFKNLGVSRGFSLAEQLFLPSKDLNDVRYALASIIRSNHLARDQYTPLQPFIASSHAYWLSDYNRETCTSISLMLEAYVLAVGVELDSRAQTSTNSAHSKFSKQTFISKEYEHVSRFVKVFSRFVRKALLEWMPTSSTFMADVEIILDLIHYVQHLRRAASQPVADFSTLHAISAWINRTLEAAPRILEDLDEQIKALHEKYALSSGQRAGDIWAFLYLQRMPPRALNLLNCLGALPLDIQKSAADLVALMCVTHDLSDDMGKKIQVIEDRLVEHRKETNNERQASEALAPRESDMALLTIEMNELACLSLFADKSNLKESVCLLGHSSNLMQHAPRLVAYQLLLWKSDAKLSMLPELVNAHLEWHRTMWRYTELLRTSGPSVLYTPVLLKSAITASVVGGALKDIDPQYFLLNGHIAQTLLERLQFQKRENLLVAFLLRNIEVVLYICLPNLDKNDFEEIAQENDYQNALTGLTGLLQRHSYVPFISLRPALDSISRSVSWSERIRAVGKCWITLSQILLSLYVPNIPIDPLRVQGCQSSVRQSQKLWLQSQIHVHSFWEQCKTGDHDNIFTRLLRGRSERLEADSDIDHLGDGMDRQSDLSLLQSFWKETRDFLSEMLSSERLERFLLATTVPSEGVLRQETLLQDAITKFIQRMTSVYGSLQDLMLPIELAMVQLRFGLRTLRHSSTEQMGLSVSLQLEKILSFPSVGAKDAASKSRSEELIQPGFSLGEALLLQLAAISQTNTGETDTKKTLVAVRSIYDRIMELWDADLVNKAEKAREAESLYRSRQVTHDAAGDDPDDEQVLQMFPTYSQDEEIDMSSERAPTEIIPTMASRLSQKLLNIHFLLFDANTDTSQRECRGLWQSLRSQLVPCWMNGPLASLPCNVDDETFAFRLDVLHDSKTRFQKTSGANAYSFYRDANLTEAKRAVTVVKELTDKLDELIRIWPDQLVLQHLRDRCDSVLSMNMESPVAKMLGAIERLLLHTEDWETFANRENSLSIHRQSLTELIVAWRKLELTGWKSILDSEAQAYHFELNDWWFRLYDAVTRGSMAACQDPTVDALSRYLDSLTPLVEDFVTASPLGQYHHRLKMILSFASMTLKFASIDEAYKEAMDRVSQILFTIHHFYEQFSGKISGLFADQRASIEKDIQSLVKLATWKDVNVHALQQSAHKTHRQLYKRIRKFRELLRQPVVDQLVVGNTHANPSIEIDETHLSALACDSTKHEYQKGRSRVNKFASILSGGLGHIFDPFSAVAVEELSGTILSVQEGYASSAPTKNLSPNERQKWNSALLVRKKRSWNDFLKELKRIGLSPNVKPEILQRHRNSRYLMEQPSMDMFNDFPFVSRLKRLDHYFYCAIGLLRDLVQCDLGHHADLNTRELQRGVSSFESGFSIAMSARTRISNLLGRCNLIRAYRRKLHELEQCRGTCVKASVVTIALQKVAMRLAETVEALKELVDVAANMIDLSEDISSMDLGTLDGVRDWISSGSNMSERLSKLSRGMESSNIMTEDDCTLIRFSEKLLAGIESLLVDVSDREPSLRRLCDSIRDWSKERTIENDILDAALSIPSETSSSSAELDTAIDLFLVIGQDLLEVDRSMNRSDHDESSNHIHHQYAMLFQVSRVLRLENVLLRLHQFSENLHGKSASAISDALSQLLPFLDNYIAFTGRFFLRYSAWTQSLLKLIYISGHLILNVAKNGFCKPVESENDEGAGEGAIESAEGTGLGQGEGKEDVTNQIEDESQFEGIKGQEDDPNGQQKEDGDDEAIDVDFDLGGELEDGEEQDSSEDEETMPELDDEFGQDISDDLKPVDENFWNETPEDTRTQDEELADGEAKNGESQMVAKEQAQSAGEPTAKEDQDQANGATDGSDHGEQDEPGPQHDEPDEEMNDNADLLESSQTEGQEETSDDVENLSIDEEFADPEEGLPDDSESTDRHDQEADSKMTETDDTLDEPMEQNGEEVVSKADIHAGIGGDGGANTQQDNAPPPEDTTEASTEIVTEFFPSTARETKESASSGQSAGAADQSGTVPTAQSNSNTTSRGTELGQNLASSSDAPLPNPHRSLGDALREVRRRFDEILDATSTESLPTTAENADAERATLEYVSEASQDVDMQALGPALGEETAKLNKLSLVEEQDVMQASLSPESSPSPHTGDEDQHRSERLRHNEANSQGKLSPQGLSEQDKTAELQAMDVDNDGQNLAEAPDISSDEQKLSQDKRVEIELNKWLSKDQTEENGQRIWQLYDSLTQSLSFSLCEQLRLILEPTRATRLMGDFRTGKRLNMKKIIPYIASNYTKDKIWLRRVRPSQREYQVLIALDDSRSMAESHSIHLAFQTLALVSKALNRLEVGDVSIASFGERMQMVHGFEDGPFTDQAGIKVVETFKFAQTATDVRSLLESSVEVLTRARERRTSSSSSDLWQLELIISDGICQDHEELRAIMRKAEEKHILLVFIVIDAQHDSSLGDSANDVSLSQNSIINMSQAMYRTVNGRLELHMQRYLDSFPFEFFVILKNVETLPDVLADTLRQFFERISAS